MNYELVFGFLINNYVNLYELCFRVVKFGLSIKKVLSTLFL
jgi:hypothetical protein